MFSFFKKKQLYPGTARQHAFIVGTGRSGTTILAQVLNSHSRICVPHELQFFFSYNGNGDGFYEKFISGDIRRYRARDFISLIENKCPYNFDMFFDYKRHFRGLNYPQSNLKQLLHELIDHICYSHGKQIFFEQTPWYGQRLDVLKELFPDMKVIHVVRDGRDVALSYARTPWWSKDVGQNLLQWEKEVTTISTFGDANPDNYLMIRYEDMVCNPEEELQRILDVLGLSFEQEMLDPSRLVDYTPMFKNYSADIASKEYHKWEQAKKSIFFPDSIYSWKRNRDHDFAELSKPIRTTLERFNYSV